jgi:Glycosyltransferase family 9 (heptosyltransferase)
MESIAIIPSKGLGDLCVTLGMAYNLSKKFKVTVFHPLLKDIKDFFPFIEAKVRPSDPKDIDPADYNYCLLVYEDSLFFNTFHQALELKFQNRLITFNPVVTNKADYKFCDNYFFNCQKSFSSNLNIFAKRHFNIDIEDKTSGFQPSTSKDPKLIVFHVTASKESKSWPHLRFLKLKTKLEKAGFRVIFATLPHETSAIAKGLYSGLNNLNELAETLAKASLLIANESGVAHLASALKTPSIVLCRNKRIQKFWGADYEGTCYPVFPSSFIPNLKGLRIRDKFWKYFISVTQVQSKVKNLM